MCLCQLFTSRVIRIHDKQYDAHVRGHTYGKFGDVKAPYVLKEKGPDFTSGFDAAFAKLLWPLVLFSHKS